MRIEKFNTKNKSRTKLVQNAKQTDSYIFVEDATKLPEPPALLSIDDEIVLLIAKSGNRLQVVRAQEGTKATVHFQGASVENRITAGTIEKIYTQLNMIKQKLLPGMRKLLIFYSYPRAINGVWNVEQEAMTFARYSFANNGTNNNLRVFPVLFEVNTYSQESYAIVDNVIAVNLTAMGDLPQALQQFFAPSNITKWEDLATFGNTNVMCILKDANGNYIAKKGNDWLNDLIPYVENTATVRMPVYL